MKTGLLSAACLLFFFLSFAQNDTAYKVQWQEIDSIIVVKDLPKTALQKVNAVYADAKRKGLHDQVLKALLYQLSLQEKTEETSITKKARLLIDELRSTTDKTSKAVLDVMLANELSFYCQQNAWRNRERTDINEYKAADVAAWSNAQLQRAIDSCYDDALRYQELLQRTKLKDMNAIIIKGNAGNARPTLYDIVAHEALDYYKTGLAYLTQPRYPFTLNDAVAMARTEAFLQQNFSSSDTASQVLKAVNLFQELIRFHSKDADPAAFIDADIERIEWAHNRSMRDDKDSLYRDALQDVANRFSATKPGAEAWYLLAKEEADKAESYTPFGDTADRYGYVKAKAIIEQRLTAMPDSCYGNDAMKVLLNRITNPKVSTNAEAVNIPGDPFRLRVEYKNIDTLYARIIWQRDIDRADKQKGWNLWKNIGTLPFIKTFKQPLPATGDYQKHSVEIKAEALPSGDYTILFSSSPLFSNRKDRLATQPLSVSQLAYMCNRGDYFVVDRETGQPLKNVKMNGTVYVENRKTNKSVTKKIDAVYSDEKGHITLPVDIKKYNYQHADLTLRKGKDTLEAYDNLYRYSPDNNDDDTEDDSDYEEEHSKVYFFTDRSIYRPGQTVWFKGIVTTKDRKTKRSKLYHYTDSIEVDLYDANSNQIDSQFVVLNEYGSFSGTFTLPQQVLTGEFSIETMNMEEGEAKFNVEEYKRPLFYIEFDTLKNPYRLNDTITITGSAKAFAGNAVDGARVMYHIERSASYPHPYLFWNRRQPYSPATEIVDSVITTDADGSFRIRFVAAPDSAADRKTEPLFDFAIELSVTDANGETHEARTNVQVAYQAVQLQVNAPGIAETKELTKLFITTKNSAGENVPASVKVRISPLAVPAKAYRKRLWQRPDQYVMSREEFERTFPYDEYGEETDYHNWQKEQPVVEDTFNTTATSGYALREKLKQGWYCIEATTKDKDGSEVKDVKYVQVYDVEAAGLPSPQINFSRVISNTGRAGDNVKFLLGSSERNLFAVIQIKKSNDPRNGTFSYQEIDNSKKETGYTIQPGDDGSIGMYYSFVKHNRFYTGSMQVYVNQDVKGLAITYATYRNRTMPGDKETWTVQVSDSSGKAAKAELLTGMYDASLDQFKKHQWDVPYTGAQSYVSNDWNGGGFTAAYSDENDDNRQLYYPSKTYDHIAGSANEFWVLYNLERYHRIVMSQFTPPRIVGDDEVAVMSDSVQLYKLQGKALGVQVESMSAPVPLELRGSGVSYFNEGEMFVNATTVSKPGSLSEVVVTAYGTQKKTNITGSIAVVTGQSITDTSYFRARLRSLSGVQNIDKLLVVIDDVITDKTISGIDMSAIDHVEVYKGSEAKSLYGEKASDGVVIVITKDFVLRSGKKKEEPQVQVRRNFSETAFFYPQLHADGKGNYSFSFTMPDAVTTWKWMSVAHTKDLNFGYHTRSILSQKILMVQPNLPRFLREGDSILLTAKISNLSDSTITGKATLLITDAITNEVLNDSFKMASSGQSFSTVAGRTTIVNFPVRISSSFTHPLTIKVVAASGQFSDGEERILPVLSRRKLVTETLPIVMKGDGTKHMVWDKLKENHSSTLVTESLTVEYTPNPAWQVVQALPYLMEYPHQCAEQMFNRFYANALAQYIVVTHPQIKQMFEAWQSDTTALQSKLEANPELKNILLNETPWVSEAAGERTQKKNIALLFANSKLAAEKASVIEQLKEMQLSSGGFPWFSGGKEDRYITQYILTGIGKLMRMNVLSKREQESFDEMAVKALQYLDKETEKAYTQQVKDKGNPSSIYLAAQNIQYWYMRSFFTEKKEGLSAAAFSFFVQQAEAQRSKQSPYMQGMIALALKRLLPVLKTGTRSDNLPAEILHSLEENAVTDSLKGIYWKANEEGYYWYQSPVEAQALLIDAFTEIMPGNTLVEAMQQWLIMNKQTRHWNTTKATADACYALLQGGALDSSQNKEVTIKLGDSIIKTGRQKEAGTGYIKQRIEGKNITPAMGDIAVSVSQPKTPGKPSSTASYGAVYWQYFEDVNKLTSASLSSLSVNRGLFIETSTDKGKQLQPVTENRKLATGDKLMIRLVIKSDRDMDYVQLTDTRAATMEPVTVLSEYHWQDGLGYYQSTKDVTTDFFIDHLSKGTYVLEYPVYITHSGYYSAGMATLQCMYAPQFAAHSEGASVEVVPAKK